MADVHANENLRNFETVFGPLQPYERNDFVFNATRHMGDFTELMRARAARVVPEQITGLMLKSYRSWITHILLPIRLMQPGESSRLEWTTVHYDPGYIPEVATQGVGRYFSHSRTKRGETIVRRGAVINANMEFYNTAEGRKEWAEKIMQVASNVQRTHERDGLIKLLTTPYTESRRKDRGQFNRYHGAPQHMDFESLLRLYNKQFATINKSPSSRGLRSLLNNMRTIMVRTGVYPDTIVLPPSVVGFYYDSPDNSEYYRAGPKALENREMASHNSITNPVAPREIMGLMVIDTHVARSEAGLHETASDLLTVPFMIGEFVPMELSMVYRNSQSFEDFQSTDRDVQVWSESADRMTTVSFAKALKYSHRFVSDADGEIVGDGELDADTHAGIRNDMFVYQVPANGHFVVCESWGQMRSKYLTTEDIANVVTTAKNALGEALLNDLNPQGNDPIDLRNGLGPQLVLRLHALFDTDVALVGNVYDLRNDAELVNLGNAFVGGDAESHERNAQAIRQFGTDLEKIIAIAFLLGRITYKSILRMHNENVAVPINFGLFRTNATFQASTVIMAKSGSDLGETVIGKQTFGLAANPSDDTMQASYFYHGAAVVKNPKNLLVCPGVFVQKYERGLDTAFVKPKTIQSEIQQYGGVFESKESILSVMLPASSKLHEKTWVDVRGTNERCVDKTPMHESHEYTMRLLGIDPNEIWYPGEEFQDYHGGTYAANTICWHGECRYGRNFKNAAKNKSPLGVVYDGVAQSREEGTYLPVQQAPPVMI